MNIIHKFFLCLAVSLPVSLQLQAQSIADACCDDFRNWVRTIGSDEFGGRKPMTPYETKTIDYIAGEFRKLGLKPAFGESYFQPVKEISTTVRLKGNAIKVKTDRGPVGLSIPEDVMVWTTRAVDKVVFKDAEFVFCGFGIDAPEYGWNDFEGVDVRGKILIVMVNDPGFYDESLFRGRNMTYYGRWTYKLEQAQRLGAAGCLIIHNEAAAGYGWHVCVNGHQEDNLALFNEATGNSDELGMRGWLNENACRRLFEMSGLDYDNALSSARKPGFKAIPLKARSTFSMEVKYKIGETNNVGAVLPGTDLKLKDECVVFSAHWDHFGIGKPDGTGDAIYNGASDNGSGLAAILMIAKKMQNLPAPRRSILFLAATSEESGLFGSQYYCEHPVFPMEKTITCINFDCIAPAPLTRDITILGGGESNLDGYILSAAAAQGRYVVFDDDNSDGWFFRSDHWNFVRRGVDAVVMEAGKDLLNPDNPNKYPQASWYHKPNDEYREDWDIEGTIANVNLMFSVGLNLANPDSCGNGSRLVILAAEEAEYNKCREIFPEIECIRTGVGAGNVIKACRNLPKGTRIINIGYAGSNNIEIGTVSLVSDSFRYTDGNYRFEDHANPLHLSDEGLPCYTGNSFFTESDKTEHTLYDMELNYIASFTPHLELVAAVKIVSDNLSVDAFLNNAIRSSGVLTGDEVWANVRQIVGRLLSRH